MASVSWARSPSYHFDPWCRGVGGYMELCHCLSQSSLSVYLGARCRTTKLITRVSKQDDDSVLQLGSRIFTLQCVSSQFPSQAAQPPFQGLQHPEQLEDWSNRESIPPSLGTTGCVPGTWCCPHPTPTQALLEQSRREAAPQPGAQAGMSGTLACAWTEGMSSTCPFCPDTSSSLPPGGDSAALWLVLSTPDWTIFWS